MKFLQYSRLVYLRGGVSVGSGGVVCSLSSTRESIEIDSGILKSAGRVRVGDGSRSGTNKSGSVLCTSEGGAGNGS